MTITPFINGYLCGFEPQHHRGIYEPHPTTFDRYCLCGLEPYHHHGHAYAYAYAYTHAHLICPLRSSRNSIAVSLTRRTMAFTGY
ncbi:hypothetical protein DN402_09360 [Streptomyces sp. SW4]|nr:hypothetical protein DN402_09360 [Streptomyces sp. SW4]